MCGAAFPLPSSRGDRGRSLLIYVRRRLRPALL